MDQGFDNDRQRSGRWFTVAVLGNVAAAALYSFLPPLPEFPAPPSLQAAMLLLADGALYLLALLALQPFGTLPQLRRRLAAPDRLEAPADFAQRAGLRAVRHQLFAMIAGALGFGALLAALLFLFDDPQSGGVGPVQVELLLLADAVLVALVAQLLYAAIMTAVALLAHGGRQPWSSSTD